MSSAAGAPWVKSRDRFFDLLDDFHRRTVAHGRDQFRQPVVAEILIGGISGLGHAVAEQHQDVALLHLLVRFLVCRHRKDSENHAAAGELVQAARGAHQQWRIVARVGEDQFARCWDRAMVMKKVMKRLSGQLAAKALVEPRRSFVPGRSASSKSTWTRACKLDISSDAGMPLPATSPTSMPMRPSGNSR